MDGNLLLFKNTAVCYILECYMHGSSIQFVVFKQLSYCFKETIEFDKKTSFARSSVSFLIKSGDIIKRISVIDYSISLEFLWIENGKLSTRKFNFRWKYCRLLNFEVIHGRQPVHSFVKPAPNLFLLWFWNTKCMAVSFFYAKICLFITPNWVLFPGCECYLSAIEFIIQALHLS